MVAAVVVLHRSTQKVLAVLEEDILLALVVVEHNLVEDRDLHEHAGNSLFLLGTATTNELMMRF